MIDDLHFAGWQWWLLLGGTIVAFMIVAEIGFRLGRRRETAEEQEPVTGTVLTSLLALLGLLLAFSYNSAETRFEKRKRLVVEEANAISTTYLRAQMLPTEHATQARKLLRLYVEVRLSARDPKNFGHMLQRSREIHDDLWQVATAHSIDHQRSVPTGLFIVSLNRLIDLHAQRINVILHHRLPTIILMTLYIVAALSMAVLGFNAGLTRERSVTPAVALVVAISIVVLLIIDLDRPYQRLFRVSQQAFVDVRERMISTESKPEQDAPKPLSPIMKPPAKE